MPALLEVGAIFKRFIVAVDSWPWRLALLCADAEDVSDEVKRNVAQMLVDASECCLDDFSAWVKELHPTVEAVLNDSLQFLRDVFSNTPLTNVASENRCSSAQQRWSASHGHVGGPSTLASDHVLGESKLVLDSTTQRKPLRLL